MEKNVILVVDDDLDTLYAIRKLLEHDGFDVLAAEDPILAYRLIQMRKPDLILVDIMMPELDGIGFIKWVRNNVNASDIPVVAMTAYDESYLKQAIDAGAILTLRKPIEIPDVSATITLAFGRAARQSEEHAELDEGYTLNSNQDIARYCVTTVPVLDAASGPRITE